MATGKKKKACCEETKKDMRHQLVAAALSTCWFESEREKEESIRIYSASEMSIEDIIMITEGLRDLNKNAGKIKQRVFGSNSRAMSGVY